MPLLSKQGFGRHGLPTVEWKKLSSPDPDPNETLGMNWTADYIFSIWLSQFLIFQEEYRIQSAQVSRGL